MRPTGPDECSLTAKSRLRKQISQSDTLLGPAIQQGLSHFATIMLMSSSIEEIRREWLETRRQLIVTGLIAVGILTMGATYFHFEQNLSWVDSFYFCTVTLTTVGYGDITPQSNEAKIFIMVYILSGIGVIASFANLLIKNSALRREYKRARRSSNP